MSLFSSKTYGLDQMPSPACSTTCKLYKQWCYTIPFPYMPQVPKNCRLKWTSTLIQQNWRNSVPQHPQILPWLMNPHRIVYPKPNQLWRYLPLKQNTHGSGVGVHKPSQQTMKLIIAISKISPVWRGLSVCVGATIIPWSFFNDLHVVNPTQLFPGGENPMNPPTHHTTTGSCGVWPVLALRCYRPRSHAAHGPARTEGLRHF